MTNSSQNKPQAVLEPPSSPTSNEVAVVKEPKLTLKETLFLKLYTDPKSKTFGNQTMSAMESWKGQTYESASVSATRTLEKAKVTLSNLMDRKGLSDGKLMEKFSEWLDAKKLRTSFTEEDQLVPDYQTQTKAGEMLMRIKGIGNDKDSVQQAQQIVINVTRGNETS